MDICTSLKDIKSFNDSILTIGAFDGMHLGHMKIINTLINEKYISSLQHTGDMGIELCKAEIALKNNLKYIQDKDLVLDN